MSTTEERTAEQRLLAMCAAEFGWQIDDFIAATRAVVPSLIAERDALRELTQTAVDILAMLAAHAGMLGHYLDTDDNDGQRLREQASALGIDPSTAGAKRIDFLTAAKRSEWRL